MELREFPMDKQSCPLVLGSCNDIQAILWPCVAQLIQTNEWMKTHADGYTRDELVYTWDENHGVQFLTGVELSQFDLISSPYRNVTIFRKQEDYSILQVSFNLRRKQGNAPDADSIILRFFKNNVMQSHTDR